MAMRWDIAARILAAAILLGAALFGAVSDADDGVKAPMLTLMGGAIVVTWLVPLRRPEWGDLIPVIGTLIATAGSGFWLMDATNRDPSLLIICLVGSAVLVVFILVLIFVFWGFTRPANEPIDFKRRAEEWRVKEQLDEIVTETIQAGARFPGGDRYEGHDNTISTLFMNTRSMVNDPYRWTYAPKEHKNLIDNYVVARLRCTAEIAINKHPYQCKYGAIAHNLSEQAQLYLHRIELITEFDPLPMECPQCKEPKPTHKANCMAAICWRCKYPTPPHNPDSQNATVITPQCNIPNICFPRGEVLAPFEPIATRVKLPFTIPQNGEDQCFTISLWPEGKRDLKELLNKLNHD